MKAMVGFITAMTLLLCISVVGLAIAARVNAWEKANAYPYGRLCDLYHTCQR